MKISVVIPSRWNIEIFGNILKSLNNQTFKDFEVILIVDRLFDDKNNFWIWENQIISDFKELDIKIFCNVNHDGEWKQNNASFLRNVWILNSKWEFINIFDDDIIFWNDYLGKSLEYHDSLKNKEWKEILIAPTMIYRETNIVQSQGFSYFNFWFCRPVAYDLWNKEYGKIRMFSGNSLFGKSEIFKEILFDETFDFVNEDLDFTYRVSKKYGIFVLKDLIVNHMERDKTTLENLRIWSAYQSYKRAKHRIRFVKKNWNFCQKCAAYSVWLLWNNLWMTNRILKYGKSPEKFGILRAFVKWVYDWIRFRI